MPIVSTKRRRSALLELAYGAAYAGGYYAGQIAYGGNNYAIVVAPKSTGELNTFLTNATAVHVNAMSLDDSVANTAALSAFAPGGARTIDNLTIGGFTDWQVPSKAVMSIIATNLKPTITTLPAIFKTGGAQVFTNAAYWTSTAYDYLRDDSYYELGDPIYGDVYHDDAYSELMVFADEGQPSASCPSGLSVTNTHSSFGNVDGRIYTDLYWNCTGYLNEIVDYENGPYHEVYTQVYQAYRQNPVSGAVDYTAKTSSSRIRAVRLVPI